MFKIKAKSESIWDIVSLGEVMIRFDPGNERIHTARAFSVCEGGGEYNVARSIAKNFALDAAIVTALADNQLGRLVEDMMWQSRVDTSNIIWRKTDGMGRAVRNGIYFIERGFGVRAPVGCSDRGNTAVSQLKPGDIDWQKIFAGSGTRWFHTGGIFAGLSDTTPVVARAAMEAARGSGAVVSYDLNYRDSLWAHRGGRKAADKVNSDLLQLADVVFGVHGFDAALSKFDEDSFRDLAGSMIHEFPNIKLVATTLRNIWSASRHDIGGAVFLDDKVLRGPDLRNVEVLDRVGSGDAFAAGLIYGLLSGREIGECASLAVAGAALSLACIGDGSSATLSEIEKLAGGHAAGVER